MPRMRSTLPIVVILFVSLSGCKDDPAANPNGGPTPPVPATTPAGGGHAKAGTKQSLGTKSAGGYQLEAFQSGPIEEGDVDLVVTGGPGKPKAVRFWVGAESGRGSVKALAEEETPNSWHVHPEVPKPLPPDAKFWAEIEPPTGSKVTAGFDVKR